MTSKQVDKVTVKTLDNTGHSTKCLSVAGAVNNINSQVRSSDCWVLLDGSFHGNRSVSTSDLEGISEVTLTPQIAGG